MRGSRQRAFCQSRRLALKDNQMLLMQRMKDSSLRLIVDCRGLPPRTSDFGPWTLCVTPPIVAAHECALQGPKRGVGP
jgi:hypothetical protein